MLVVKHQSANVRNRTTSSAHDTKYSRQPKGKTVVFRLSFLSHFPWVMNIYILFTEDGKMKNDTGVLIAMAVSLCGLVLLSSRVNEYSKDPNPSAKITGCIIQTSTTEKRTDRASETSVGQSQTQISRLNEYPQLDEAVDDRKNGSIKSSTDSYLSNKKFKIVIGILTIPGNVNLRNAQRKTWIATLKKIAQGGRYDVIIRFLIDNPSPEMIAENKEHGDIVFLYASYVGKAVRFGEKMLLWFRHAYNSFPSANVIGKMDDDVFLCIPQVLDRIKTVWNDRLYYGWAHDGDKNNYKNVTYGTRVDEMFLMMGRNLVERIIQRKYCYNVTGCIKTRDLFDTNYGGTSVGTWLSVYNDLNFVPDNRKIVFERNAGRLWKHAKNPKFCNNLLVNHKVDPKMMYKMHNYNH